MSVSCCRTRSTRSPRPATPSDGRIEHQHRRRSAADHRQRHRADRGAGARVAGHHRPQLQARRAGLRPARVPRPVRHRPALLLPGGRRDPGAHPAGRRRAGALDGLLRRPLRGAARARSASRAPRSPCCRGAAPSTCFPVRPCASSPSCTGRCCRSAVEVDGQPVDRRRACPGRPGATELFAYGEQVFGFTPFDVIELNVPEAGLTGAAFVLPTPVNPATRGGHRVYLKRMLLAESVEGLLPEWAFFARCVVDSTELRPTASREALYDDGLLNDTREAIADQLRGWLVRLADDRAAPAGPVPRHPPPRRQGARPARRRDAAPGRAVVPDGDQHGPGHAGRVPRAGTA